jgi:hypothetical protein
LNPATISAFSALAGVAVGGLAPFGASWLTQRAQFRHAHRESAKLEALRLGRAYAAGIGPGGSRAKPIWSQNALLMKCETLLVRRNRPTTQNSP